MIPNKFIIDGDVCRIELYNACGNVKKEAIIDVGDFYKVKDFKWSYENPYVVTKTPRHIYLHHMIMGVDVFYLKKNKQQVDHKNHDDSDNRKLNLRICTASQNMWNSKKQSSNKSGHKGVSWCKYREKWRSVISFNGNYKHIGYFDLIDDAIVAHNVATVKYHGEYANTT